MALPEQTPLYHSILEARYSRQELIRAIEAKTKNTLLVYFANIFQAGSEINPSDIGAFGDLLDKVSQTPVDLFIHSPGGDIDVAEKIILMCRRKATRFRIIVPNLAKSAATLIALGTDEIVMGYTSELGPIDPQIRHTLSDGSTQVYPAQSFLDGLEDIKAKVKNEGGLSPAYFPLLNNLDPALLDFCHKAIERSKEFAKKWLKQGMLKLNPTKAEQIAEKLCEKKLYLSHGMVIDVKEAKNLGLNVHELQPEDELWKLYWLLYIRYDVACRRDKRSKIFESTQVSISL
ncbi:MAG: hypothetical protein HY547_03340 [Elusimicrobia bacterium]|nr:hypothetical protein [Elusimicrobiota bacterium]